MLADESSSTAFWIAALNAATTWLLPSLSVALAGDHGERWRDWLGRARELPQSEFGARQAFADALGVDLPQVPWARACAEAELNADQASRVLALVDPLQTRVEMFNLRLLGVGVAALDPAAVATLIEVLNGWIAEDELQIVAGQQHWYLCGKRESWSDPACLPPDSLLGACLNDSLPAERQWQRLLNETQMFLNQDADLQRRRADGAAAIDSLWFWGGGGLSTTQCDRSTWVDALEFDFRAVATRLGLATSRAPGASAIVEGDGTLPLAIPLALSRGALRLHFASGERFLLRRRDRYRFWSSPYLEASA